jgi:hypothetical protein
VNGITLIAKSAELAVKLRKLGMAKVSRRSNFASPPDKALKEFLSPETAVRAYLDAMERRDLAAAKDLPCTGILHGLPRQQAL